MIAVSQFSFTIIGIAFCSTSLRDTISFMVQGSSQPSLDTTPHFGDVSYIWTWGVSLLVLLSLLAWVRNIANFSFTFLFANVAMFTVVLCIMIYSMVHIYNQGLAEHLQLVNTSNMWSMVGFSIFTYEGIGILMPVMQACECPEKFDQILVAAIMTLTVAYIIFGNVCYMAFG